MSALTDALAGRYVQFTRTGDTGLELQHQGRIIAADGELALIELVLTADGGPPVQGLVHLDELVGAFLYESAEQMNDGLDRFEEYAE
ncbi:hypothetical protein [Mycolicibacterium farcinogenes]|uniref:Uncharacterized protein n=1 Tax=Mycolicibacterium farcinogenes TaxID=1802 RepID=A0ACD1F9S5_MYCFR|nr:hypothetical protein [Mycolicibacterium farcinogenes]QZH63803.1 hypothetical protein K6L26_17125 [Mycolicibacterium farcinogenes]